MHSAGPSFTSLLVDDVMHLVLMGQLEPHSLKLAIEAAVSSLPACDGLCGAIVADVTGARTDHVTGLHFAQAWRAYMLPRPTAIVHRDDAAVAAFWHGVAMRLASRPAFAAPLMLYPAIERRDAVNWCREHAAVYRSAPMRSRRHP